MVTSGDREASKGDHGPDDSLRKQAEEEYKGHRGWQWRPPRAAASHGQDRGGFQWLILLLWGSYGTIFLLGFWKH